MKLLKLLCLLLFATTSFAQTDSIVRYWKYGIDSVSPNIETKDIRQAATRSVYYRKDGVWKMESRFVATGHPYMFASYVDVTGKINQGEYILYFKNGRIATKTFYFNDKVQGLYQSWYKNGQTKDSFYMKAGKLVGKGFSWDSSGNVVSAFDLDNNGNGTVTYFNEKHGISSTGKMTEGVNDGTWIYYTDAGIKEGEVVYENDKIVASSCFDSTGNKKEGCIFMREAEPSGGPLAWKKWLEDEINKGGYPSRKTAKHKKAAELSGEVSIRFLIEKDGSISDAAIVKSLNPEADGIALSAIKRAPKWTPGIYRGKLVRSYRTQPLTFVVRD